MRDNYMRYWKNERKRDRDRNSWVRGTDRFFRFPERKRDHKSTFPSCSLFLLLPFSVTEGLKGLVGPRSRLSHSQYMFF